MVYNTLVTEEDNHFCFDAHLVHYFKSLEEKGFPL
jgi:hypothetical protein